MSKLMRMKLSGIRSFGPDDGDAQHIKFHTPLTLIQGQNGCGKTTIIEALKFAITGDLPGGTAKGQGFVYDPKLAKCFETRGQVKLRVADAKGDTVTVSKLVSVSQKANNKLEFKRLDSSISRSTQDEAGHISGKCADIDSEMCLALGVSKPVLNNVIFCHQEDSHWPLDESKKLKEKFDDIFDATKYNKCQENITKYVKKNVASQKLLTLEVGNLLDVKQYAEQLRESLREKEEKLEQIGREIGRVKAECEPIGRRIGELDSLEADYNKLYTDVVMKRKELADLEQQQTEILRSISEFEGTDAELQGKVRTHEQDLSSLTADIRVLEAKRQGIEAEEQQVRASINAQNLKLGELQAEEKRNTLKVQRRHVLLNKSIQEFGLQGVSAPETDLSEHQVSTIISSLRTKLASGETDMAGLEKTLDSDEKRMQSEIDRVRETGAKLKQNIDSKGKQLGELRNEERDVQHRLQALNTADDQLQLVDSKLSRLEKELSALEASVDVDALRATIETERQKSGRLEDRLALVDSEIQSLQTYTTLQTELDLKREHSIQRQDELQKLRNKHEQTFRHMFPDGVPSTGLKGHVESYQKAQAHSTRTLNSATNEKQREVMSLESNLRVHRDKLQEQEAELAAHRDQVAVQCQQRPLDSVVEQMQGQLEKLQNQRSIYYSSKYLYQKFIAGFQADEPSCPICKRAVPEPGYAGKIVETLNARIETFPEEIRKMDAEISEQQAKFQALLALKPLNEKIKQLESMLPTLQEQVTDLDVCLSTANEELQVLRDEALVPQQNEDRANRVLGDATLIDQHQRELTTVRQEIASLVARMPRNESARGMQQALGEQESLRADVRTAANRVESLRNRLAQHTDRLQKQQALRNEFVAQRLQIRVSLQDKDHLVSKGAELEVKRAELEEEFKGLQTQVEPARRQLAEAVTRKDDQRALNKAKVEKSRARLAELRRQLDDIGTLQTGIDEFQRRNVVEQMAGVRERVSVHRAELNALSTKKVSVDKSVEDLRTQVANRKVHFRELQDNLALRKKRRQAATLTTELDALETKLGDDSIASIRRERTKLRERDDSLRKEMNFAQGRRDELRQSIAEVKRELCQPKYMQACTNYKRKFLELRLHARAVDDLNQFVKAMDWALMQFHKQRMVQINGIVKELWRTIYKGNDCDYIEIKTDDITAPTSGSDRRRVYNYRVVQVKNGIELDMRGRCSAGQRVLASLIIRIALADTFSTNCGILALDEPTTNLDRENIHSLSEALVDLVSQKRQQKNFQLVVITHDQEFVDRLTRVESLESYYVISRNEAGKSTISIRTH